MFKQRFLFSQKIWDERKAKDAAVERWLTTGTAFPIKKLLAMHEQAVEEVTQNALCIYAYGQTLSTKKCSLL